MTHARGKHSEESYQRRWKEWEAWRAEQDLPRRIVLDFSYRDDENKDVVFTEDFLPIVEAKLKARYEGGVPMHATDGLEFGDVLNRFPLRVQRSLSMVKYRGWLRGSFQQ